MSLKVYNTLTRKKEMFKPMHGKNVQMFVCGPTVYDNAHLGHAKTYVQFDIIARYLRWKGFKLFYLQNLTDIDDKIIKRAQEQSMGNDGWKIVKDKFSASYLEDMKSLH